MKLLLSLAVFSLITMSTSKCGDKKTSAVTYKGKLEIKALCMNYTLKLLEGDIDKALIDSSWTNESTGKSYTDVFGLGSPCTFPSTIKEGDEFYFVIDSSAKQECAVCM